MKVKFVIKKEDYIYTVSKGVGRGDFKSPGGGFSVIKLDILIPADVNLF